MIFLSNSLNVLRMFPTKWLSCTIPRTLWEGCMQNNHRITMLSPSSKKHCTTTCMNIYRMCIAVCIYSHSLTHTGWDRICPKFYMIYLTSKPPVYSVDSLVLQRAAVLLNPAVHCYSDPALSGVRDLTSEPKPEKQSLPLWLYNSQPGMGEKHFHLSSTWRINLYFLTN
jgi:hypothetical protein